MSAIPLNLTVPETAMLRRLLVDSAFQRLIGAEEWDLSEPDEEVLWGLIKRVEGK